jgi:hypothetical protein
MPIQIIMRTWSMVWTTASCSSRKLNSAADCDGGQYTEYAHAAAPVTLANAGVDVPSTMKAMPAGNRIDLIASILRARFLFLPRRDRRQRRASFGSIRQRIST